MAMSYQNFASLGVNLNRQKYGPLDISNVFTSAADLKYYLTKGTFTEGVSEYWYKNANEKIVPYPYEGQVLATVIDGVVEVFVLALDAEGNFETREIAGKIEVDGTTIVKDASGKLSIVAPVNPDSSKTYNFAYANGVYSWVEVDTATAAGQAQAIAGLTDRTTAIENTLNGTGEGEEHVAGLVEKVAANAQAIADETAAREAAIGVASKPETTEGAGDAVEATGLYKAIEDAEARAKAYADAQDADTVYDDTALAARVKALEDEERYDDTELSGRVTTAEGKISALEGVVGNAESGLVKGLADEIARAEAAEKALGERIDGIDYVDEDELSDAIETALEPVNAEIAKKAAQTDLEALQARVEAFLDNTGAATEAIDTLQELITYINEHDDVELSDIIADVEALQTKVDTGDQKVSEYVTAAIDALKIGDYAKAADLTELAGRVSALEAKPFDTYAIKSEVESAISTAKSEAISDADSKLANKVNTSDFDTFKGENTTAIGTAKSEAIAAAKTETESQVGALEEAVADTYATKTALGEAVEGIENELLAYAKTADVNTELAKKVETATIAHAVAADPENGIEAIPEGVTKEGTTLKIVVDAPTRAETTQMIADKVAAVTGGESAAAVKLLVEAETERSTAKDEAHDAALAILNGDASKAGSVAEAKALAQKGVDDAAKVAGDLVTANAAIADNTREIGVAKSSIETVNTTLTEKITALENADTKFTGDITALQGVVSGEGGHASRITALEGRATNLETRDTELAALIQGNTDKFASYSTTEQMNKAISDAVAGADLSSYAKVTALEAIYKAGEGEAAATGILAEEIARAKAAEEANAGAIAAIVGEDSGKTIRAIATEEAKAEVAALVGEAPEALDTIHEIASWIKNDETGAAAMSAEIAEHSGILAGFGGEGQPSTVLAAIATAKQEAIDAIPALAIATAEVLGGVKSSDAENKVAVGADGTMEVNSMNVNKLVQTSGDTLILNGGSATVQAAE